MVVRLEFTSTFEMLDFVQVVSDHVGQAVGLDDDTQHYVGVAIREGVINAIKHGNGSDPSKHVFVEFSTADAPGKDVKNVKSVKNVEDVVKDVKALEHRTNGETILTIRVRDQGPGFDPETVADPLAPENLLKASGRGIFLIRSFMDDVQLQRAPEGGMEILMVKRVP
jgi:serine/threonine-protein kinase RsbW